MNDRPMTCDLARDLAAGYVLGALEPAEEAAVREHLRTCPEAHDEFAELGGVVAYLAEDVEQVGAPAGLGDRILAAAAADLAARSGATGSTDSAPREDATALPPLQPTPLPSSAERAARDRRRIDPLGWLTRIAAVLAVIALGAYSLSLQAQVGSLQSQLTAAREFDRAVAEVIGAAAHPGSQTVVLTPEGGSGPSGLASVATDGSLVIAMRDLPPTTGQEVYETWVIREGEAPLAVGGFAVDQDGVASFRSRPTATPPGSIVALTLEPTAGNTAPMGPIVSKGVAPAPVG